MKKLLLLIFIFFVGISTTYAQVGYYIFDQTFTKGQTMQCPNNPRNGIDGVVRTFNVGSNQNGKAICGTTVSGGVYICSNFTDINNDGNINSNDFTSIISSQKIGNTIPIGGNTMKCAIGDNYVPTVVILTYNNGTTSLDSRIITFSARDIKGGSKMDRIELWEDRNNNGYTKKVYTKYAISNGINGEEILNGTWQRSLVLSDIPTDLVIDGDNFKYKIIAYDRAGNSKEFISGNLITVDQPASSIGWYNFHEKNVTIGDGVTICSEDGDTSGGQFNFGTYTADYATDLDNDGFIDINIDYTSIISNQIVGPLLVGNKMSCAWYDNEKPGEGTTAGTLNISYNKTLFGLGDTAKISVNIQDAGGSKLKRVILYEKINSGNWILMKVQSFPIATDPSSISVYNSELFTQGFSNSSLEGTYSYKIRVYDNANNYKDYINPDTYVFDKTASGDNNISINGTLNNGLGPSSNYTYNTTVSLALGTQQANKMKFSCNNINWSPWEDYSSSKIFNLSNYAGAGCNNIEAIKNIYVIYKDTANNDSSVVSSEIIYDKTNPAGTVTYNPNIWTNGNVTINIACSDGLSGCVQGTYNKTVSANETGIIQISDLTNNQSNIAYNVDKIDKIIPTITDDSGSIWINGSTPVEITLTPTDTGGSLIKETKWCEGSTCSPLSGTIGTTIIKTENFNNTIRYQTWDNAGNASTIGSFILQLDSSIPTIDSITDILLKASNSYSFTGINASDTGGSGVNQYKVILKGEDLSSIYTFPYQNTNSFSLGSYLETVSTYDFNNDGISSFTISMQVKDAAGNESNSIDVGLDLIAGDIDVSKINIYSTPNISVEKIADASTNFKYSFELEDSYMNPVRQISGIRNITMTGSFINSVSFLPTLGNNTDGAILYDKNQIEGTFINNTLNNYFDEGSEGINGDGIYEIAIQSLVPTLEYGYQFGGDVNINNIEFSQTITCGTYDCNTNSNINSNLSNTINPNIDTLKSNLKFKEPLTINISTPWTTITPGSYSENPINLTFTNNSTQIFNLDHFRLLFTFDNTLPFYDVNISGLTDTALSIIGSGSINVNKGRYFDIKIDGGLNINGSSSIANTIYINADDYGQGFGNIGFMSYIPHDSLNKINNKQTSYNTNSWGVNNISAYSGVVDSTDYTTNFTNDQGSTKINITGLRVNKGNTTGESNASSDGTYSINIDSTKLDIFTFKTNIKKSVEKVIRGISFEASTVKKITTSDSFSSQDINGNKILYYDLSNCNEGDNINGNKGCIVTLDGDTNTYGDLTKKIGINGIRTIVIKGGSLYIKGDMYYQNNNSLLGIVILRDENDKTKGGNLYIDPNVTNVVGTIFTEGSIMSYDGSTLYPDGFLGKQLLIYGSLFSSNTIGDSYVISGNTCPYGSDYYSQNNTGNCSQNESAKYDLARLRTMVMTSDSTLSCSSGSGPKDPILGRKEFALAGKAKCFIGDTYDSDLRTTIYDTAVSVEYNPAIQSINLPGFTLNK